MGNRVTGQHLVGYVIILKMEMRVMEPSIDIDSIFMYGGSWLYHEADSSYFSWYKPSNNLSYLSSRGVCNHFNNKE